MVSKEYDWLNGAVLLPHSKCKHKILRDYFAEYLLIRCQIPQQSKFRLAVVDGFSGGGRYACNTAGSPIIFVEETVRIVKQINLRRNANGMAQISFECLFIFNDFDPNVIDLLRANVAPLVAAAKDECPEVRFEIVFMHEAFEIAFSTIKERLIHDRYRNVIFNLDQCGHSQVEQKTLFDVMTSFPSPEVFFTFSIESLISFLKKSDPEMLRSQLAHLELNDDGYDSLQGVMSKNEWLGAAERLVFASFEKCAKYVSPFSIHNPEGWRYWLIHLANSPRARQVYNNILHDNCSSQAHYGRSGLSMLSYDPSFNEGGLYLFETSDRENAKRQLMEDIPRLVFDSGNSISVSDFYASIYNMTPAHMDDINLSVLDNPDMAVVTKSGSPRRKANTFDPTDRIKIKRQRSFFPIFRSAIE